MSVRLRFVRGTGWSSKAIEWFSAGPFSHVDAVGTDGLYGARSDAIGGKPPGVQWRPFDYEKVDGSLTIELQATFQQETAFWLFLRSQEGKPYDAVGIWGFATGRDWREPGEWFCSELQAAALEEAKLLNPLYAPASKVTPSALCVILSAVGGRVVEKTGIVP